MGLEVEELQQTVERVVRQISMRRRANCWREKKRVLEDVVGATGCRPAVTSGPEKVANLDRLPQSVKLLQGAFPSKMATQKLSAGSRIPPISSDVPFAFATDRPQDCECDRKFKRDRSAKLGKLAREGGRMKGKGAVVKN